MGGAGPGQLSPDPHSKETGSSAAGNGEPLRVVKTAVGCLDGVTSLTTAHRPGDSVTVIDHGSCVPSFTLLAIPSES